MKEDLQIPTLLIWGSAVHYRPLWSFYQDGIIVSHLVGPMVPAQTLQSQNVPGRDGVKIAIRSGSVFFAVSPWSRPGPQTVANTVPVAGSLQTAMDTAKDHLELQSFRVTQQHLCFTNITILRVTALHVL